MGEEICPPYKHVVLVTVGLSVIDKTLKEADRKTYDRWMGGRATDGELANKAIDIDKVERGNGLHKQHEIEMKCFKQSQQFGSLEIEVKKRKRNRYSGELSSLHLIFSDRGLSPDECRIVLVATDSADGLIAARLNKRIIAHRLFKCPPEKANEWNSELDNGLHESLARLPIIRVPGLQVKKAADFTRDGNHGFEQIVSRENKSLQRGERMLNITGGFKGVIPIASAAAWRYHWELAYLYEETDCLIYSRRPGWITANEAYEGLAAPVVFGPLE